MHKIALTSLAAALLASCSGADNDTAAENTASVDSTLATDAQTDAATPAASAEMAPTDAAGYVAKAGASDKWEIESSKAFLAKSNNADLKKFAQMMVDHHTQSTAKVKAAAQQAKVTVPEPKLDAMQQQMLDDIKNADATGVDAVYSRHQKTAHQAALALHQGYASNGDTDALKKAASEIVPVVQKHIAELGKMPG